ncbi:hypothetical protein LR48_Vigan03g174800 [Vigna angularis]|uniref:Uncharacterized protein n=2 Tax=Phaseolus angularis TaxID=3914 RepID=A0A0L9U6G9_PHAAN|nr:hypothetical protein LR48_Vigan03g174800 [Vigna angularis]
MSALDPEHEGFNRCENGDEGESLHGKSNNINNKKKNKDVAKGMKPLGVEESKDKDESNGERLKEKSGVGRNDNKVEVKSKKNAEDEHEFRDDDFIGPGSPSFREYCNDYDSGDRSSMEYSNDSDSSRSIKNGSETLLNRNNKPMNEESVDSNKEPLKKERRGRGFRNAIGKRKTRGRRNLLNFACYSGSTEAHAQGS